MQDLFDDFDIDQSILKEVKAAVGRLVKCNYVLVGERARPWRYRVLSELQSSRMVILLCLTMKIRCPPTEKVREFE